MSLKAMQWFVGTGAHLEMAERIGSVIADHVAEVLRERATPPADPKTESDAIALLRLLVTRMQRRNSGDYSANLPHIVDSARVILAKIDAAKGGAT